jgi:hypothetical protein
MILAVLDEFSAFGSTSHTATGDANPRLELVHD